MGGDRQSLCNCPGPPGSVFSGACGLVVRGGSWGALVHRHTPALNEAQTVHVFCQFSSAPNLWQIGQVRRASGSIMKDTQRVPEPVQRAGPPRRYGERSALPQTYAA